MKTAIIVISKTALPVALRIKKALKGSRIYTPKNKRGLQDLVRDLFDKFDGLIFISASGIAARVTAPCLRSKYTDPAVVVVDAAARFAISLVSGHEGGANELAVRTANILGAQPVVTTRSEACKRFVIGMGTRRGIKKEVVKKAIKHAMKAADCTIDRVRCIATVDLKQNEKGLARAAQEMGIPLRIISSHLVNRFNGEFAKSEFVKRKIGLEGVCEPCALIEAKAAKLVVPKMVLGGVTAAVAMEGLL